MREVEIFDELILGRVYSVPIDSYWGRRRKGHGISLCTWIYMPTETVQSAVLLRSFLYGSSGSRNFPSCSCCVEHDYFLLTVRINDPNQYN